MTALVENLPLLPYLGLLITTVTALRFVLVLSDSVDAEGGAMIGARAYVSGGVFLVSMMGTIIGSSFIS